MGTLLQTSSCPPSASPPFHPHPFGFPLDCLSTFSAAASGIPLPGGAKDVEEAKRETRETGGEEEEEEEQGRGRCRKLAGRRKEVEEVGLSAMVPQLLHGP